MASDSVFYGEACSRVAGDTHHKAYLVLHLPAATDLIYDSEFLLVISSICINCMFRSKREVIPMQPIYDAAGAGRKAGVEQLLHPPSVPVCASMCLCALRIAFLHFVNRLRPCRRPRCSSV